MSSIYQKSRTPIYQNPCKQIGFLKTKIPKLQNRLQRLRARKEIWIQRGSYAGYGKEVPKPKTPKGDVVASIHMVGLALHGISLNQLTIKQAQLDLQNAQKNLIKQNQECNKIIQKYGSVEAYEDHLIRPIAIAAAAYKAAKEKCRDLDIQRQKASKNWMQIVNPGVTSGPRRLGLPKDAPAEVQQAAAKAKAIADNLNKQYAQCINREKEKAKIEIEKSPGEIAYAIALKKCQERLRRGRKRYRIDPCPSQIKREDFIQPPRIDQRLPGPGPKMPIKLFITAAILFGIYLLVLFK